MRKLLLTLSLLAGLGTNAGAASMTGTVADPVKPKPPLQLTEAQRQRVVEAVSKEDTLNKPLPDYRPVVGAQAPKSAQAPANPLPRPLVYEIPALKQYYYVRLPDTVMIVDPMTNKIVDLMTL